MKREIMTMAFAALLAAGASSAVWAQGQSGQGGQQQNQKSPLTDMKLSEAIQADVVYVVKQHIQKEMQNNMFRFTDPQTRNQMQLQYQEVPDGEVKMTGPNAYVAQGRFQTQDGKEVRLDFMVEGADRSDMRVTRTMVYSMDGQNRYEWQKSQGDMYRMRQSGGQGGQQGGSQGSQGSNGGQQGGGILGGS